MKKMIILHFAILLLPSTLFGQHIDSTDVVNTFFNSKNDSILPYYNQLLNLKTPKILFFDMNNQLDFAIHNSSKANSYIEMNKSFFSQPIIKKEYDVATKSFRSKILPSPNSLQQKKFKQTPFPFKKYELPTKEEFDVLSVLWKKGDVTGTVIYESDAFLKITFEDLRKLLKRMTEKGWLARKQVSPSQYFTFQVQGNELPLKIEMSQKNRRNQVFLYHSNIEYEKMKNFIIANAYMVDTDPTIIYTKELKAARSDTNLVKCLYQQVLSEHR